VASLTAAVDLLVTSPQSDNLLALSDDNPQLLWADRSVLAVFSASLAGAVSIHCDCCSNLNGKQSSTMIKHYCKSPLVKYGTINQQLWQKHITRWNYNRQQARQNKLTALCRFVRLWSQEISSQHPRSRESTAPSAED